LHTEFHENATHAWIGFEPAKNGTVLITGGAAGQGQTGSSATIEPVPTSPSDNTSVYILIGGIIAAGIAGIIIVKKTRKTEAKKP
jgi:LPXTG-motif cell wall-anchored protein